jgi:hypothetical protein
MTGRHCARKNLPVRSGVCLSLTTVALLKNKAK